MQLPVPTPYECKRRHHVCAHSCFNHFQTYQICNTKNCVDMCARHRRGAIEICLSEKGALAKKRLGKTVLSRQPQLQSNNECKSAN